MYVIETEQSFDAAHFLKGYLGKCKNIHGHRWRVVAAAEGKTLQTGGSEAGMLADFGDLKAALGTLTGELDHALLVEKGSLRPETTAALEAEGFRMVILPFRTTAENLARYFYDRLTARGWRLREVRVYETPASCARYFGEQEGVQIVRV